MLIHFISSHSLSFVVNVVHSLSCACVLFCSDSLKPKLCSLYSFGLLLIHFCKRDNAPSSQENGYQRLLGDNAPTSFRGHDIAAYFGRKIAIGLLALLSLLPCLSICSLFSLSFCLVLSLSSFFASFLFSSFPVLHCFEPLSSFLFIVSADASMTIYQFFVRFFFPAALLRTKAEGRNEKTKRKRKKNSFVLIGLCRLLFEEADQTRNSSQTKPEKSHLICKAYLSNNLLD